MGRIGEVDASPLSATGTHALDDAFSSRTLNGTAGQSPCAGVLRRRGTAGQLSAEHHRQHVVGILEVRRERQRVRGGHT